MSRSERIEKIIQQRKPLVEKITSVKGNLYTLIDRIKAVEVFKNKLINDIEDSSEKEEIREFVSQISNDGKERYYNYLPVKKVEIICSFPQSDLGKIVLIDTPGIGDTKLDDPDIRVKTVGEDIDAVIFIKNLNITLN